MYRVVYTRHICFSTKRGDEEIEIPAYVRKTLSERAYSNLSSFSLDHAPFTIFVVTVNKSREKRVRGLLLRLKEARKMLIMKLNQSLHTRKLAGDRTREI